MQFADVANPFGTDAFAPAAVQTPVTSVYYKRMKLVSDSAKLARAPKPLSHTIKNFLLNYNG